MFLRKALLGVSVAPDTLLLWSGFFEPLSCCSVVWYKPESMVLQTMALNTPVVQAGIEPVTFWFKVIKMAMP